MGADDAVLMTAANPAGMEPTLGERAEEQARQMGFEDGESLSEEAARQLIYELRVQQIELKLENEKLRQRQEELGASLASILFQDEEGTAPEGPVTVGDITEPECAARAVRELAHDLRERVKELNCLYGISELVEKQGISLEEILQGTADLIPPAWQYPDITCARIIMDGQEYRTRDFAPSPWQQVAEISVYGEPLGVIQVGYLQERPECDEGPFLKEERSLLNVLAERTGRITERIRAQDRLRHQHQFLQTVLDSLTHPFYVINTQTYAVEVANAAAHAGLPRGDLSCYALTHGNDLPCDRGEQCCPLGEVKRTKAPVTVEHVHVDKHGRLRYFEVHGFPVADADGNVVQMIEYTLDVTERKRAEEALRRSETLLRETGRLAKVGGWELDLEDNRAVWTEEVYRIHEIPKDYQPDLESALSFYAPEDRPVLEQAVARAAKDGEPWDLQLRFITAKGKHLWVRAIGKAERQNGKVVKLSGTFQDITERRQVEEALRESEVRWRSLTETSPDHILLLDTDLKILFANFASPGLTVDDLIGTPLYTWVDEARQPEIKAILEDVLRTGVPARYETVYDIPAGGRLHYESHVVARTPGGSNRPIGLTVSARDITERKQAEEALARQEAELRATIYSIGDAVIATDTEGRVLRMNPVAETLTGWTESEAAGRLLREILHIVDEETHQPVENPVERVLREGVVVGLASRSLLVARGGSEASIAGDSAPILDPQGKPSGVVVVFGDQTAERLRQRSVETRLSLIQHAASHSLDDLLRRALDEVGAFVQSPIGFYHFVNTDQNVVSLQQWSTRTLEEFCQAEGAAMSYDIDRAGVWTDCVRQRKPVIHNDYVSLPHKKGLPAGHAELIRELVVPVMREGRVVAILGVGNKPTDYTEKDVEIVSYLADVTWEIVQQKRAEEALRDNEAKLRALLEFLPVGVAVLDASRMVQLANPALERILDLSQEQLHSGDYEARTYLRADGSRMLPEEFPSIRAVEEQRPILAQEVGVVNEDGRQLWASVSSAPLPFEDWTAIVATGDITRLKRAEVALQRAHSELEQRVEERTAELQELNQLLRAEIAERRHVEEELRSSEERFRQLANHIDHVFWMADLATNQPLYVSPAYEKLWGRTRQSLYEEPTSFLDAIHPEDRQGVQAILEQGREEEQSRRFRLIQPDGSLLWVRLVTFPVQDEQGRIYRVAGIAEEITEQVRAVQLLEQRVEERTRQLSALLQIASSMALTLELGALLDLILDGLQELVEYDAALIYELQDGELFAVAHRALGTPEELSESRIPLVESAVAQRALSDQQPLLLSDVRGSREDSLLAPASDWAVSGMVAPIGIRERAVGLLVLYSKRPQSYSKRQAALVLALANQAAVSIENAHLYRQAQALAAMEERQRLARDLHDAVSQTLFSANIIAEALPRIWDRDPEGVRRRLPQLHRLTSGALAEMRTLLLELRPAALLEVELSELLRQAVDAFSGRTQTMASLALVGRRPLPGEVQLALYRIAQEALNNVVKHARATEVKLSLQMEHDRVELRICDDGRGFEPDSVPAGRMGLNIVRERARSIGATVEVSSQVGEGTEIVVVWKEAD